MKPAVYEKRKGGMRNEGAEYLYNLTLTTWLRADKMYGVNYQILPGRDRAGNLEVVVLKYVNKDEVHYRFLQAKHFLDESQTITSDWLFEKNEIKIEKYFKSYEEFNKKIAEGKIEDLILFTNLALYSARKNGSKDVTKYVTALPAKDRIFQYKQKKKNGSAPIMHKLNSNFFDKYKKTEENKLTRIVQTFTECCVDGREVKQSDDLFIECQFIISEKIADVEKGKFSSKFINGEGLSEGTKEFKRILLEKLAMNDSPKECLENIDLKFAEGFGKSRINKKIKDWPIWTPEREKLFKTFCDLFKLATNQPNEKELVEHIESEYANTGRKLHLRLTTLYLKKEIRDWDNKDKSPYPLNSKSFKTIMSRIDKDKKGLNLTLDTEKNIEELSPLKLEFQNIPFEKDLKSFFQPSENEKNLFHLNTQGYMNVSLQKLFKCLEKLQQIDFLFYPKTDISKKEEFLNAFRNSEVFNILVCEIQSVEMYLEFIQKVHLINENKEKKVILVTNFNNGVEELNTYRPDCEDLTYFKDLTEETQKELSEREIFFQGADVAFNSIYGREIPPTHQDIDSWGILLDNQIRMNNTIFNSDLNYYINREWTADIPYFNKDTIQQQLGDQHIVTYDHDDYLDQIKQHSTKHVHFLYELDDYWFLANSTMKINELSQYKEDTYQCKFDDYDAPILHQNGNVFIISDMAGYGKTTTTSYLANEFQKQHPDCWVTRLQPSNLRFDSDEMKLTPEADIGKYDAFLMEKFFHLESPLERLIFKQYLEDEECMSQLFFIFDGFDEIGRKYQKVIIQAVKYLKTKRNVRFIAIGTRPQHQELLENELQSVSYRLFPFCHKDKITFLEKFWVSRGVKDENEGLMDFSKLLIDKISKSISDKESELTGIPLRMRMIGEIYEEDVIKFLAGDLVQNKIVAVDLFALYERFIWKKENVYFNDKLCKISSTAQRSVILKPFRKIQTEFARKIIFCEDYKDLKVQLKDCVGFGIIQEHQGEYRFIHRTFAEFLFAKYFLDYTLSGPTKVNNGQLMQVMSEGRYSVVRKFINCKKDYKKMASELTKAENLEAILQIEPQQFEDAIRSSVDEDTNQVLCFLLELYCCSHPKELREFVFIREDLEKSKEGLLQAWSRKKAFPSEPIIWMTTEWLKSVHQHKALLELLSFLIPHVFIIDIVYGKYDIPAGIITDLQDKLENEKILSKEYLKKILFEIELNVGNEVRWDKQTIDYLKHLKMNHEQLFYLFLREKNEMVQYLVEKAGNDEFYELIGGADTDFVFDVLIVPVLDDSQYMTKSNRINLKPYLNYLSKYIKSFNSGKLQTFNDRLMTYGPRFGWCYVEGVNTEGIILFEFISEHLGIECLHKYMQDIKTHKKLSFIENCALWGWNDVLEFILNKGDIEVKVVEKLQLKSLDRLDAKIEKILTSIPRPVADGNIRIERIRGRYSTEIKITRVFANN